jgi:hypothetical protein
MSHERTHFEDRVASQTVRAAWTVEAAVDRFGGGSSSLRQESARGRSFLGRDASSSAGRRSKRRAFVQRAQDRALLQHTVEPFVDKIGV